MPLLPLHGQVLLPTAFVRVQVSRKALRRYVDMFEVNVWILSDPHQSCADAVSVETAVLQCGAVGAPVCTVSKGALGGSGAVIDAARRRKSEKVLFVL